MYRAVAESADADFHFETGRELAERLGYDPDDLAYVPDAVIDSFANSWRVSPNGVTDLSNSRCFTD